jgi:ATP-dependent DNA helicase RecQ
MLLDILNKFWGYNSFRTQQEFIINSIINGHDTLVVLPTGGGKSICYQIPAIAATGTAIVISPLVALMKDQVYQLSLRGIPAAYLSATQSINENEVTLQKALDGEYKLLYIAPERLLSEKFMSLLSMIPISFIAVDEAHCISQWGHDFRPAYRKIYQVFEYIKRVPIMALTASAIPSVKQDIIKQLQLKNPATFEESIIRHNLFYEVVWPQSKYAYLNDWNKAPSYSSIIYCNSRKRTEELALMLRRNGMDAQAYHAGMHKVLRHKIQEEWITKNNQTICATAAFGMGIDKPNVRLVLHMDLPTFLESYYQEAGRAGRDGAWSRSTILVQKKDVEYLKESIDIQFPPIEFVKMIYGKVMNFVGVTIGEGFEELLPFNIMHMIQQFQLPLRPTIAAIKFLQKDGYWQWNETEQIRTKIQIIIDQYSIKHLEKMHPKLHKVIITLLRMYGSIFTFPTYVDEFNVAKVMNINKLDLDVLLQQMHEMGIIYYSPATNDGTLFLLNDRLPPNYVNINIRLYQELKQHYVYRIEQLMAYINNQKECRNVLLAQYFGESDVKNCNNCDNCKRKQTVPQKSIAQFIKMFHALTSNMTLITFNHLENIMSDYNRGEIIEYLRIMIDEGIIEWDITNNHIKKL